MVSMITNEWIDEYRILHLNFYDNIIPTIEHLDGVKNIYYENELNILDIRVFNCKIYTIDNNLDDINRKTFIQWIGNNDDIRFENNNSKKRRKIKRFESFLKNNNIKIQDATVTFLPYIYKYEIDNDFNNFNIPIYITPEKPDGIVRIK